MKELAFYTDLLSEIKTRIRQAQVKVTLAANADMILPKVPQPVAQLQPVENTGFVKLPQLVAKFDLSLVRKQSPSPVAPLKIGQLPVAQMPRIVPESLKSSLPTIEEIEAELQNELGDEADEP